MAQYAVQQYSQPQMAGFRPAGPPSWEKVPTAIEIPEGVSAKEALRRAGALNKPAPADRGYYSATPQQQAPPSMLEAPPPPQYRRQPSYQAPPGYAPPNSGPAQTPSSQAGPVTADRLNEYAQKLGLDAWVRGALSKTQNRCFIRKDLAAQLMAKVQAREIPQTLVSPLLTRFDRLFPPQRQPARSSVHGSAARSTAGSSKRTQSAGWRSRPSPRTPVSPRRSATRPAPATRATTTRPAVASRSTTYRSQASSYRGRTPGSQSRRAPAAATRRRGSVPDARSSFRRAETRTESKYRVPARAPARTPRRAVAARQERRPVHKARSPVRSSVLDPGGTFREQIRRSVSRGRSSGYKQFGRARSRSLGGAETASPVGGSKEQKIGIAETIMNRAKAEVDAAHRRLGKRKLSYNSTMQSSFEKPREIVQQQQARQSRQRSSSFSCRRIAREAAPQRKRANSYSTINVKAIQTPVSVGTGETRKVVDELERVKTGLEADIDRIAQRLARETEISPRKKAGDYQAHRGVATARASTTSGRQAQISRVAAKPVASRPLPRTASAGKLKSAPLNLSQPIKDEADQLRRELQAMKNRIDELEQSNQKLHHQLRLRSSSQPPKRGQVTFASQNTQLRAMARSSSLLGGRKGSSALAPGWRSRKRTRYSHSRGREREWSFY